MAQVDDQVCQLGTGFPCSLGGKVNISKGIIGTGPNKGTEETGMVTDYMLEQFDIF